MIEADVDHTAKNTFIDRTITIYDALCVALFFTMTDSNNHDPPCCFSAVPDDVFTCSERQHEVSIIDKVFHRHSGFRVFLQNTDAFNNALGGTLCRAGIFRFDKVSQVGNISGCAR